MNSLNLDSFLTGPQDIELRQYKILHGLKHYRDEFSRNRLYPSLAELIQLCELLEGILQRKSDTQSRLPQHLKELDIENKRLVYEPVKGDNPDLERAVDLIVWALPLIRNAIDEGMSIYSFVDEHIVIEEVGILPIYREEGYLFVSEIKASLLHLLRYEVSLFTSRTERYRTLKTRLLESIEQALIRRSPESIKLALIEKYQDLPNPATFLFSERHRLQTFCNFLKQV